MILSPSSEQEHHVWKQGWGTGCSYPENCRMRKQFEFKFNQFHHIDNARVPSWCAFVEKCLLPGQLCLPFLQIVGKWIHQVVNSDFSFILKVIDSDYIASSPKTISPCLCWMADLSFFWRGFTWRLLWLQQSCPS